ncbi:MAG: NAD(P)H-binding protein [Patulibacter sp.]
MKRVLVTGATGTVGAATLRALPHGDVEVVAYVRDPARLLQADPRTTIEVGDLRDDARLRSALQGVDAVVLISGHGRDLVDVQQAAVASIRDAGVRRVVKVSGSPVATAEESMTSVGRDHVAVEQRLRESVPEPVVLRPNVFMQNLLAMAPAVEHGILPGPPGNPSVSFVDANDVGRAAAAAALAADPRSMIALTGPEAISYELTARTLADVLDQAVAYAPIPVDVMRQGLEAAGDEPWLAEHKIEMAERMALPLAGEVTDHFAELVGEPPATLKAFLTAQAAAFVPGSDPSPG